MMDNPGNENHINNITNLTLSYTKKEDEEVECLKCGPKLTNIEFLNIHIRQKME